jgi:hypothetical protein
MEQAKGITLVSVNIEGRRHLEDRVIPFLKDVSPDVVNLQEVYDFDLRRFSEELGMEAIFAPMRIRPLTYREQGENFYWGLATLSRFPISRCQADYFQRSSMDIPENAPNGIHDDNAGLVLNSTIQNGAEYNLGNTHFTWTPDGYPSSQQDENVGKLLDLVSGKRIILSGDTNAARVLPNGEPGRIWRQIAEVMKDNIPVDIGSTIDGKLHKAGDLNLVVDGLFTNGYFAKDVTVVPGISDHCAIVAQIQPEA